MGYDFSNGNLPLTVRPTDLEAAADLIDAMVLAGETIVVDPADIRTFAAQLRAAIQDPAYFVARPGGELTYFDGRCSGTGYYPLRQDTDNPADTNLIRCVTCDVWGYTNAQVVPKARYYE